MSLVPWLLFIASAAPAPQPDSSWVTTKHSIQIAGKALDYEATAGFVPLKNDKGDVDARMFFTAYTLPNPDAKRPITFIWNGGPGSASIWLHLGCMGPRRAPLNSDGSIPRPPYHVIDNDQTWLPESDLVFVDPVGTGYSRADKADPHKYWNVDGDITSIADFIQTYLRMVDRSLAPVFIAGESYGAPRAAGLSNVLQDRGLALSGIVLISSAIDYGVLGPEGGNDLPYATTLPSYTAVASYHHKLSEEYNAHPEKAIADSEEFAFNEYLTGLALGDQLTPKQIEHLANRLSHLTGLSADTWRLANLRVGVDLFRKELLKKEGHTLGGYDARVLGTDPSGLGQDPDYDASDSSMGPPVVTSFSDYMRNELGFKTDATYYPMAWGNEGFQWNWDRGMRGRLNQSGPLSEAMRKDRYLAILSAQGMYDLVTPFFGSRYTLHHLDTTSGARITYRLYPGGHMMYVNADARAMLHHDFAEFVHQQVP